MPRYTKYVPVRMGSRLLDRVNDYMQVEGIKDRSKAIRELIEIGASIPTQTLYNGASPSGETIANGRNKRNFFHNENGERIYY